ncbi:MAG: META domain-containing protein [Flavobacterium sp.]|uniref:META domain-containing protein n=1 Tax=Flavobacterium sp. TaxID=239 RepID=UPI0011FC28C2|nr:META domain-containing protein [Flavobacterium sp.]RZJ65811.1 MAG: META domain-containing protein [Flavobacterium sp.]
MKKLFLLIVIVAFASCTPKKAKDPEPAPTEIPDTILADTNHTAKNSLNYLGMYKGKFPLKGYPGTQVTLELSEEFNYTLQFIDTVGKGRKSETMGTFKWDSDGHTIELSNKTVFPNEFTVNENSLVPKTDRDGKSLTLAQTEKYKMAKLSDAQVVKSDESPQDKLPPKLTGIHWKLSEINGKVVKQSGDRDYFIQLNKDGSFGAFAGCNRMGGKYEFKGSKVRMFNIISTMMACADMKTEEDLKKNLETADNFVANEKVLQFRKGGVNLLKFEAVAQPKP